MFLVTKPSAEGQAVGGFGVRRNMTGAIGSGLNDMHHATSAFRIATDIERVCSHQNAAYRINPRVKFHYSHTIEKNKENTATQQKK